MPSPESFHPEHEAWHSCVCLWAGAKVPGLPISGGFSPKIKLAMSHDHSSWAQCMASADSSRICGEIEALRFRHGTGTQSETLEVIGNWLLCFTGLEGCPSKGQREIRGNGS